MIHPLFVNPLIAPMMIASASTIALRSMLMIPSGGRLSRWQRKEAGDMVFEKAAAIQESQLEALTFAISAMWMPWTAWTGGAADSKAFEEAADRIIQPFSGRASRNARRLTARAMNPMLMLAPPHRIRRR
jgi:hypothetical protein